MTIIAAVACILLIVRGCNGATRFDTAIALTGALGIVLIAID